MSAGSLGSSMTRLPAINLYISAGSSAEALTKSKNKKIEIEKSTQTLL